MTAPHIDPTAAHVDLLDTAARWIMAGVIVLPVKPDGSKAPQIATWARIHRGEQAPPDIAHVIGALTPATGACTGIGVLTGPASGNLEMLELEGRAVAEGALARLDAYADDNDMTDLLARLVGGYVEHTPSGGMHLFYRLTDAAPARNTVLARRPATPDELADSPRARWKVLAETRGAGGYVVVAPSHGTTHPTGRPWVLASGGIDTIPAITGDERDRLWALIGLLDEQTTEPLDDAPATPHAPSTPRTDGGLRPGDDYNARASWDDILGPHGWRKVFKMGRGYAWRRPGKDHGISATTGQSTDGQDRLYVFTTSTEFQSEEPISKFYAHAILDHGGDKAAAARALAKAGYGTPMERTGEAAGSEFAELMSRATTQTSAPSAPGTRPELTEHPSSVAPAGEDHGAPQGEEGPHNMPADIPADEPIERTSWWPRDLAATIAGHDPEPDPQHLFRADGHALFYPGKVNGLIGESESGKTWVGLHAVHQALAEGERVLILDFEDTAPGIIDRLRALGITDTQLTRLTYISPDESLHSLASRDLADTLTATAPHLVLLDGFNAAMTLLGLDINSNTDATAFSQRLLKPLARTGATIVYVDHVPKSREQRGKGGIGAQAKRAMTTGCALTVEVTAPFGRGMTGRLRLTVDKDRPGKVRAVSGGARYAGEAILESAPDGTVTVTVTAPDLRPADERGPWRPTRLMQAISTFLATLPEGASGKAIEDGVNGKREHVRKALAQLVTEGHVKRQNGARGAIIHILDTPFVEAFDFADWADDRDSDD